MNAPAGPRVVSLLSSATEITVALGLGHLLVGRSHECDHPAWVRALPACSHPVIDVAASSRDIDRAVRERAASALSVYRVDGDLLRRLRPDVVLTQTQCEVCAVTPGDVAAALAEATGIAPRVVSLEPHALADLWRDIERVADALGATRAAPPLVGRLRRRLDGLAATAAGAGRRPSVACIEWIEPLMSAGNWTPELVGIAGGAMLFGKPGAHSPNLDWADLRAADPEHIVVMPCGFDLGRTAAEAEALERLTGWRGLAAVRAGRVAIVDGNRYFNRPGPGLVESAEILAEILHPSLFGSRREGTGWRRFSGGGR